MKINASVVLFNTPSYQITNVYSSFSPNSSKKLFIIDNSPSPTHLPSRVDSCPYTEYVKLPYNIGYGGAHNNALRRSILENADYHIILNPDISFSTNIIDELTTYSLNHTNVGYIMPKIIYHDESPQYLCKLLPTPLDLFIRRFLPNSSLTTKMNEKYTLMSSGYDKIINPPCLSGCFMFLNLSIIKKYEIFFDEQFFMYLEDFDFIRRLHRHSRTIYYPYVSVIHDHAKKSYSNTKMLYEHIKSAIKYFNKYGWIIDHERKEMNNRILSDIEILNKKALDFPT